MAVDGSEAEPRVLVLLEKPTRGHLIPLLAFDPKRREWQHDGRPIRWYPLPDSATAVGAMTRVGPGRLLLIERDSAEGSEARHKRLVFVDLSVHRDGVLERRPVADLLAIADPAGHHPAPGAYAMPFWTLESVLVHGPKTVLIANDNNLPFGAGRGGPAGSERTEFALVEFPVPLADLGRWEAPGEATP